MALRDSGDAQAQDGAQGGLGGVRAVSGKCDEVYVETTSTSAGATVTTRYYAALRIDADVGDVLGIRLCGYRSSPPAQCPAGASCSSDGELHETGCTTAASFGVEDGVVYVSCGTGQRGQGYESLSKFDTATVLVTSP